MTYLYQNCVLEHELPCKAYFVDYSRELNLYAVVDQSMENDTLDIWNPQSGNTEAVFDIDWEGVGNVLFLPGNYLAIAGGEENHGSDVSIFSLKEEEPVLVIDDDIDSASNFYNLSLSPDKNLLVSDVYATSILEIELDLENMKVLGTKEILCIEDTEFGIECFCCSNNYTVFYSNFEDSSVSCVDVGFTADGEVKLTNKQTITYCMINGEERRFEDVRSLEHDGENLLIATDKDIIAMEAAIEGSPAHVIVDSGFAVKCHDLWRVKMQLTYNNQLMVCDGSNLIKVYDYKRPNSLQGLCRYHIIKCLSQDKKIQEAGVDELPIPQSMKDYLLYGI